MFNRDNNSVIYEETATKVRTAGSIGEDLISYSEDDYVVFPETSADEGGSHTVFKEDLEEHDHHDLQDTTVGEYFEELSEGQGGISDISETLEDVEEYAEEIEEAIKKNDLENAPLSSLIPGSDASKEELFGGDDEEKETDYANDGDLTKFMDHVSALYPTRIPKHDGKSTVGCERAISFLDRLNSDISRAIRDDHENVLDISELEKVRVNIMRDVLVLKEHLGDLKKQIKDSHGKKASRSVVPAWKTPSGHTMSYEEMKNAENIKKEAGTPRNIVIAVSPFERAISGMMINAHVSSGHPIEEVYASLKKKYDLTDREELSIMQLCMDSGFHIFKDRGSYSPAGESNDDKRGVDFARNYFA
tara:strand:- start:1280 stop:2362 length:1083 start_codon:yes stop_codon:yes gene_type:complete